jgi:hypothetical protein
VPVHLFRIQTAVHSSISSEGLTGLIINHNAICVSINIENHKITVGAGKENKNENTKVFLYGLVYAYCLMSFSDKIREGIVLHSPTKHSTLDGPYYAFLC